MKVRSTLVNIKAPTKMDIQQKTVG